MLSPYSKHQQLPEKKRSGTALAKDANKKLRKIYEDKGITFCEICRTDSFLSWHHRHKRRLYKGREELLSEYGQTILVCTSCHNELEYNKVAHERAFDLLRKGYEDEVVVLAVRNSLSKYGETYKELEKI